MTRQPLREQLLDHLDVARSRGRGMYRRRWALPWRAAIVALVGTGAAVRATVDGNLLGVAVAALGLAAAGFNFWIDWATWSVQLRAQRRSDDEEGPALVAGLGVLAPVTLGALFGLPWPLAVAAGILPLAYAPSAAVFGDSEILGALGPRAIRVLRFATIALSVGVIALAGWLMVAAPAGDGCVGLGPDASVCWQPSSR